MRRFRSFNHSTCKTVLTDSRLKNLHEIILLQLNKLVHKYVPTYGAPNFGWAKACRL